MSCTNWHLPIRGYRKIMYNVISLMFTLCLTRAKLEDSVACFLHRVVLNYKLCMLQNSPYLQRASKKQILRKFTDV
ncbi:hypothetical protein M758_3G139000 [Ceratodon purpureus]|nr:hypothetical protein M758_3G139000 [Ceratodon purpureus]